MSNSIKINLSKIQGFKAVDFGESCGVLKIRPLGSNESLEINRITRESIRIINELMTIQKEINEMDLSKLKDDDKDAIAKAELGNKLLAEREELAERELEVYVKCFALEDRDKGREILGSLSSLSIQKLFGDIFNESRVTRRKSEKKDK